MGATMPESRFRAILSHPNSLTLFRIAAVPLVVIFLIYPNRFFAVLAAAFFSAAAVTDYLDGYLARRWGLESTLGKVMDPVADKLLVSSAFIMMAWFSVPPMSRQGPTCSVE